VFGREIQFSRDKHLGIEGVQFEDRRWSKEINLAPLFFLYFQKMLYVPYNIYLHFYVFFFAYRKHLVQVVTRRAQGGRTHPSGHLTARIIMGRRAATSLPPP
jgi:hypothetical protein